MYIVGLTGGIGSGKSTVAEQFAALGVDVIDADIVARDVVAPGSDALNRIRDHFGDEALAEDGSLNRGWLRQQVFADADQRLWLEALLHPLIAERTRELLARSRTPYCLLVSVAAVTCQGATELHRFRDIHNQYALHQLALTGFQQQR